MAPFDFQEVDGCSSALSLFMLPFVLALIRFVSLGVVVSLGGVVSMSGVVSMGVTMGEVS